MPDEATALLMAEFHRLLPIERLACADALAYVQRRIAAGTANELGVADRLDALYQSAAAATRHWRAVRWLIEGGRMNEYLRTRCTGGAHACQVR